MALHKDLTGAELHEPKGIETATSGQIYVSDGTGSGEWTDKDNDNLVFNKFFLQDQMADISTIDDKVFFYVPVKSEMTRLTVILHNSLTTANAILSVYINGVLFADSLTVTYSGSSSGQAHSVAISTANTLTAGSVIEIRSNGGSDTVTKGTVQLELRAKV